MFRGLPVLLATFLACQSLSEIAKDETSCGGSFTGYQYVISSPGYPASYPANRSCLYELRGSRLAPCAQEFHLQFLDFDLRYTETCSEDFLRVGEISVYCDRISGVRQFRGTRDGLKIVFRSGPAGGGRGFKILVTTLPCISSRNETNSNELLSDVDRLKNHRTVFATETLRPVYKPLARQSLDVESDVENITERSLAEKSRSNPPRISSFLFLPSSRFEKDLYEPELRFNLTPPESRAVEFRESTGKESRGSEKSSQRLEIPAEDALRGDMPVVSSQENSATEDSISRNYEDSNFYTGNSGFYPSTTYGNPVSPVSGIPGTDYSSPPLQTFVPSSPGNISPNDCLTPNNVGVSGVVGFNGINGINGINGVSGTIGFNGINGASGTSGFNVVNGISGVSGTSGINGINGVNGANGFNVISGYNGVNIANNGYCCNRIYSEPRFELISPGFPSLIYSSESYSCSYAIRKSSSQVCRLRFRLRFFNHGQEDRNCDRGHFEIDGRRICGCRTGQSFVLDFPYQSKTVDVRYVGYPRVKFNGFVVEVRQEICGNYYYSRSKKDLGSLPGEILPKSGNVSREDRKKRELGYFYPKPSVEFPASGVDVNVNGVGVNGGGGGNLLWGSCQNRAFFDWILIAKEIFLSGLQCPRTSNGYPGQNPGGYPWQNPGGNPWQNPGGYPGQNPGGYPGQNPGGYPGQNPGYPPTYPPIFPTPPSSNGWTPSPGFPTTSCENINVLDGTISSPLYPNYYPNNANICYRFSQAPGYCYLQLKFLEFDVENSISCSKDYVTITGTSGRFCGRYLTGRRLMIDLSRNTIVDFRFVSDSYGNARGFNVGFTQVPCQGLVNL